MRETEIGLNHEALQQMRDSLDRAIRQGVAGMRAKGASGCRVQLGLDIENQSWSEPDPIAVTRSRFPRMRHLGSVSEVNGGEIEPIDVVTFGSPCQDLSIAGKRAGIHEGERSNLFFEAIRIIREMREATDGRYPTFAVWENVPGAFGEPVWLEAMGTVRIAQIYLSPGENLAECKTIGHAYPEYLYTGDYGKLWRCWLRKPTAEEMANAIWEE